MKIISTCRKIYAVNWLLSVGMVLMLICSSAFPQTMRLYNKILETELTKNLSHRSVQLIILVVSGDKGYLTSDLKALFTKNQIIHLLVLSGGNLVILIHFIEQFHFKNTLSYVVLKYSFVSTYFAYTGLQHPLARAVIFMSISDFHNLLGYKISRKIKYLSITFGSFLALYVTDYSMSLSLSIYFATSILLYNDILSSYIRNKPVLNFLIFNIYMTLVTAPLLLIFDNTNLYMVMLANLVILPLFETVTVLCYFLYFSGIGLFYIPGGYSVLNIARIILETLFAYLDYLSLIL
jgi:hypothetical protein